jgi:hypothetical protein
METMHKYRILKKDNNTNGVVALEKIPQLTPKYATVEYVDKKFNELRSEVDTKFNEVNAKLDLILQKK